MKPITEYRQSVNYHLFKDYSCPMWEHDSNINGENIILTIPGCIMNYVSEKFVINFISGRYDRLLGGDHINGIGLSRRGDMYRIFVWFDVAEDWKKRTLFCCDLIKNLPLPQETQFTFKTMAVAIAGELKFKELPCFSGNELETKFNGYFPDTTIEELIEASQQEMEDSFNDVSQEENN
ncbi:hypothetical protein PCE1_002238 [Barthelona sp. PCE]